jgi:GMP synthase-like glutamine amidotransferase/branched-subunit amino acid aminotransferase/4-amino-4-deoxychorismate lyase
VEHDFQPLRGFDPRADPDIARGVFETVLVLDGRAVEWHRHRERLAGSCRDLYGARLERGLDRRVADLAAGHRRARLRVVAKPVAGCGVALGAVVTPLDPARAGAAGGPVLAPMRVYSGYGRHKLADRDWLDRLEAAAPAGTRPLLVTGDGRVLETTRANLCAVCGDVVVSPPLDGSILPGVMRAVLLDEARRLGLETREQPLSLGALHAADAFLLTGSLALLESRVLRDGGNAGAIVAALERAVERTVAQERSRSRPRAAAPRDAAGRPSAGVVLSHGEPGAAGLLGEWLAERGVRFEVHDVTAGPMPALDDAAFVASLGSEESATDAGLAWVREENALLREAVAREVPVLGLCFGGQALSIVLGGEVTTARTPQIGWFELSTSTAEVPSGPWFHWHYEQLGLPPHARALAHSDAGLAAFRLGPHLGLQFHPEVTTAVIASWSRSGDALSRLGIDPAALVAESERRAPAARVRAWTLFDGWWARIGG